MTLAVGITGGIGSGKSTVCKIFRLLGVPVFEADLVAKDIMNSSKTVITKLSAWFGDDIYTNGLLNRKKLASYIFESEEWLQKVNALVHPLVRDEFLRWKNSQEVPYTIYEAAILFESGFYQLMDVNILVTAPEQLRIERVKERDNLTAEHILARMAKQWTDVEKRKLASAEIVNDNSTLIIPQILEIDKKLKTYGKIW
ncbi:MAG: dephospho-CoA kinase [Draconibacterium sp.]